MRKQRVALEHHIDRPPIRRHWRDILTVEQDASLVRRVQAGKQAQQRGLAAARGPEQRKEFAWENVERDTFDRSHGSKLLAHAIEPPPRPRPAGRARGGTVGRVPCFGGPSLNRPPPSPIPPR